MNQLTPEQRKRRAQMLSAHYNDQDDTHDYRSPKEWNRQAFRLHVKTRLFNIALSLITAAAGFALILLLIKYANHPWLHNLLQKH